jgi:hypothetical protein
VRRALFLCLTALLVAGCGADKDEDVPTACRDATAQQVEQALKAAPGRVRVGGVPLSRCFNRNASPGDVQALGAVLIDVAETLADQAREDPHGDAPLRLGYLLGAAERGSGRTQGIHSELIRRLENTSAGIDSDTSGYRRGQSAGRATG